LKNDEPILFDFSLIETKYRKLATERNELQASINTITEENVNLKKDIVKLSEQGEVRSKISEQGEVRSKINNNYNNC
jgi:hypothetical protein